MGDVSLGDEFLVQVVEEFRLNGGISGEKMEGYLLVQSFITAVVLDQDVGLNFSHLEMLVSKILGLKVQVQPNGPARVAKGNPTGNSFSFLAF